MNTPSPATITLLVLIPLFAWRIYKRFRRLVGRQRLSKVRLRITLGIYMALLALLCFAGRAHPERLCWLAGGVGLGALLGRFGLSKTVFEPTKKGLFYTPNAHLGIALSLLFVARIGYRLFELHAMDPAATPEKNDFARSPLTLAVFGLMAGYYIAYAVGLIRWRQGLLQARRRREALAAKKSDGDGGAEPDDREAVVPPS